MVAQAVILAGGKGERLASRLGGRPKPLVDVLGTPLLERQLAALEAAGFSRALVLVNHEAGQIERFLQGRPASRLEVTLIDDGEPRGTAGAVLNVLPRLEEDFLVVYGDTLFDVDLARFVRFHAEDPGAAASLFVHPNDHPWDSDLLEVDEAGLIVAFHPCPHPQGAWLANRVNAALYLVRRRALQALRPNAGSGACDFAKDVFPTMLAGGGRLRAYLCGEYIKDIGTPERLDRACEDVASGRVARASLRHRQRAVFLDRDGVLNALNGFVATPEQLKVFPFAAEAVRLINRSGARAVLATNQPVVARGECTSAGLAKVHAKLETVLGQGGAYLDRIYYCPHHPDAGFPGEIAELKVACDCRKPKPGLLLAARDELNIDLSQSWMMGDRAADQMAARACGVAFVLIRAGQADAALEASSDFAFDDLRQAAVFITQAYPRIAERLETVVETSEAGGEWFIAGGGGSEKTLASVLARELRGLGHVTTIVALDASSPQSLPTAGHAAASMDIKEALLTYHRERRRLSGEQAADWKTIILWAGDAALAVARAAGVLDRCILLEGAQGGEELTLRDEGRPGAIPFIISLEGCFEAPVAP